MQSIDQLKKCNNNKWQKRKEAQRRSKEQKSVNFYSRKLQHLYHHQYFINHYYNFFLLCSLTTLSLFDFLYVMTSKRLERKMSLFIIEETSFFINIVSNASICIWDLTYFITKRRWVWLDFLSQEIQSLSIHKNVCSERISFVFDGFFGTTILTV